MMLIATEPVKFKINDTKNFNNERLIVQKFFNAQIL